MGPGMAEVIEYYIPERFRKKTTSVPPDQCGKIVQLPRAAEEVGPGRVPMVALQPDGGDVDSDKATVASTTS